MRIVDGAKLSGLSGGFKVTGREGWETALASRRGVRRPERKFFEFASRIVVTGFVLEETAI